MELKKKHLRAALLIMFVAQMLGAWVLKLLINWLIVDGECVTYGHTLGFVIGFAILRLVFMLIFDNENDMTIKEIEEKCK